MNNKIKRIDEFKGINEFKTIQDLLDKYMDGATSNEEEATLRKYFEEHANDIPEEWESYRALFSYIGFEQMNLSQILKEEEKKEDFEKKDNASTVVYYCLIQMNIMNIINLGILAHIDAGKTSVTENLLFASGATEKCGRVDNGDTITDSMDIEKRRGITVRASTTSIIWNGVKCNIIDTPGHMDFIAEVERTFKMLDGAVLILSAKEGIQAQTKLLFSTLQKLQIPTIIFINKIDQ